MLMFLGSPAWIGLLLVGTVTLAAAPDPAAVIEPAAGTALLAAVLFMWFSAKIATVIDVLARPALSHAFGGPLRFLASVAIETAFFLLLSPIMWVCHTLFFAGLPFGRAIGWIGQTREDHHVSWREALRQLWPQTLLGIGCLTLVGATQPSALPWLFILLAGGPALAVPLAVISSWPGVGRTMVRLGICALPEETVSPETLRRLDLPALEPR
jgi:membrane glycosyltransferase